MAPATQPPTGSTPPSHGDRDCRRTDVAGKIHGYYAAATFADAQIGTVLDELHKLGLEKNTIIVLWGDHGWHPGDHGIWTKHTNYEQATRIPLLVIAPGVTPPGSVSKQPVESVDIFPHAGRTRRPARAHGPRPIDGLSRVPVLRDPAKIIRDHASHCYPRGPFMGRAIRTQRYRLVEWKLPGTVQLELYDYETDPLETQNFAATEPKIVAQLRAMLARQPEALVKPPVGPAEKR